MKHQVILTAGCARIYVNGAGVPRNARKSYRRAWADLRAEGHVVNRKKVQRLRPY